MFSFHSNVKKTPTSQLSTQLTPKSKKITSKNIVNVQHDGPNNSTSDHDDSNFHPKGRFIVYLFLIID